MDPFHGGAFLTVGDCRRRFENLAGSDSEWTSDFLQPSGTWSVLARILANLRQSFIAANDPAGLDWVLELRACIPGVPVQERAQRASVLATLGRYDEAAGELEALATAEESGATKHPSVAPDNSTEQTVAELRHRAARLRAKLN
jgi:regulator of sirC expression with transglutaminase-like and TPR domain